MDRRSACVRWPNGCGRCAVRFPARHSRGCRSSGASACSLVRPTRQRVFDAYNPSSRRCTRSTVTADHGLPLGVAIWRAFSSRAMALADSSRNSASTGRSASARSSAACIRRPSSAVGRRASCPAPSARRAPPACAGRSARAPSPPARRTSGGVWVAWPGLLSYRQKSLNRPGDNSVYRTVCWMLRWPR